MTDLDPSPAPLAPTTVPPSAHLSEAAAIGVIVGIFLAILLAGLDALVVATALPTIAASLHGADGITFVASAYLIASTVAIPLFSRLSDLYSRRNVFLLALGIFLGGSALAGLSQSLDQLILFRGIQGFGSGAFLPVGIAMVALLFPPAMRTRLTGLLSGAAGISIVVGPLLGSYIVDVTSWRWVFYVNLPIGVAALVVLALVLGPLRAEASGRFDGPGAALLVGWVSALMLPLVEISDGAWAASAPLALGLFSTAAVLFVAFLVRELGESEPLVPLRLLGRRVVAATGAISLLNGIVLTSLITLLSVFVGVVLLPGNPNAADLVRDVIYFFAIPLILGAVAAGGLLTRWPYRVVLAPALLVGGAGGLFLYGVRATTPLWVLSFGFLPVGGLALPLIVLGFGAGIGLAGVTIAIQNEVPRSEVGAGVGIVRFLQSLGGAVGLSLLTVFITWRSAQGRPAAPDPGAALGAVIAAYDLVFLAMALLTLLAGGLALLIGGRVAAEPRPTSPGPDPGAPGLRPAPPAAGSVGGSGGR
ncbi:MAG TPA: MFS transporter [Thermoplasmata archaeon]|nr:MFS transporter [Thermoplasmata archaeon]